MNKMLKRLWLIFDGSLMKLKVSGDFGVSRVNYMVWYTQTELITSQSPTSNSWRNPHNIKWVLRRKQAMKRLFCGSEKC